MRPLGSFCTDPDCECGGAALFAKAETVDAELALLRELEAHTRMALAYRRSGAAQDILARLDALRAKGDR